MFEVNALLFIMLVEGFVILLLILLLILVLRIRVKSRNRNAVKQLVSQIKHQSSVRMEETGSFLQDIYELDGPDLKNAVKDIDAREKRFFQKIINMFLYSESGLLTGMDAAVAELVEPYKVLRPKAAEPVDSEEETNAVMQLEAKTIENEKLKRDLEETKDRMQSMIDEFGNMFGGGSDHDLAKHEVVDKVIGSDK